VKANSRCPASSDIVDGDETQYSGLIWVPHLRDWLAAAEKEVFEQERTTADLNSKVSDRLGFDLDLWNLSACSCLHPLVFVAKLTVLF